MTKLDFYYSDDYAGGTAGPYHFYFGYEETLCPIHGINSDCWNDQDCDKSEHCFVVELDNKEICRLTKSQLSKLSYDSDLNECTDYLVLGIMYFISKFIGENK